MSEGKIEVTPLSLLEELKQQHSHFLQQKEMSQNNLNQLIGAIYACEVMIKKYEDKNDNQSCGEESNGKVDDQNKE